jgi:hypothetical protein
MQNFIVLEFTRNAAGNIAVYPSAKETEEAAKAKYHEILTRAPLSNSPVHGAALLNWDGYELEYEYYEHTPEPTPEPEAEQPTE